MPTLVDIQQRNRELAERISQEARSNPQSTYTGKYVGIANGQVVSVAESFEDGLRLLRRAEPDNTRTFLLEVGADYSKVEYIWGMR